MIGRTGLFENIVCPFEGECKRPNCFFYHYNDQVSPSVEQLPSSSSLQVSSVSQPFMGYMGYIERTYDEKNDEDQACHSGRGSQASYLAPVSTSIYTANVSEAVMINEKTVSRKISENSSISVPLITQMPLEMSVEEILDPSKKEIIQKKYNMVKNMFSKTSREKQLQQYVKTVAKIDTRIEELKKKLEIECREKNKMVNKYKKIASSSNGSEYIPTKKSVLQQPCTSGQSVGPLKYLGGYTPTPIALLKSGRSVLEKNKDEDVNCVKKTKKEKKDLQKLANKKSVFIEDLFDDESRSSTQIDNKKVLTPNISQQLAMRYWKVAKDKKAMANVNENKSKNLSQFTKIETLAGTFDKGEKRKAHLTTAATSMKLIPLDPFATGKVPFTVRVRYLNLFYNEFVKVCKKPEEAILMAKAKEKAIKDQASTKSGYICSAVNNLNKLRVSSKNGSSPNGFKTISHEATLVGRHLGSFSVVKRDYRPGNKQITEKEFYASLNEKYVISMAELYDNGFPLWKDADKKIIDTDRKVASGYDNKAKIYTDENDLKRICCRCGAEFFLTKNGEIANPQQCIYHWAKAFKQKVKGSLEARYMCCSSDLMVQGCCIADSHVTSTALLTDLDTFVESPAPSGPNDPRSSRVYALDCEMVYTGHGLSLSRITIVDIKDDLVLDILVKPEYRVMDYNSRFSGLTKDLLDKAEYDFKQARARFFEFVNSETILIGHSLESDFKAMRIVHHKVVDTSVVFPHKKGPPFKRALKNIASDVLQLIIQEDVGGHDSKEDASACMRLMLHKIRYG